MSTLFLDFETTSTCDLKKCGAWIYSRHPSTDVLCMAYVVEDGATQIVTQADIREKKIPVYILSQHPDKYEAHNAFFERSIWTNIMVARYGWPEIPENKWRCSAALAASRGLPRGLEQVAEVLKLKNQKDPRGKKFILKTNGLKRKELDQNEFEDLCAYCKQDVEVERELSKRLGTLSEAELKVWQLDQRINLRGIHFDRRSVLSAISFADSYSSQLRARVATVTGARVTSTNQVARTREYLETEGTRIADLTKGSVGRALGESPSANAKEVLEIRQALSKNSVKKLEAMLNVADKDDQIRECFLYHGASTGRWTGKLVQLQNLPRGTITDTETCISLINSGDLELFKACYPEVMGAISSCIRGMLTARPGHTLIAADYNAIETRVLFWLAGETKGLEQFRKGEDLYVDMARTIYGSREIDKKERQVGKTAILGLGYQMGADKFKVTCDTAGIALTEGLAALAVTKYREKYNAVVQFWYGLEAAAIRAVENPGFVTKNKTTAGSLSWFCKKDKSVLGLELPSDRVLRYWQPSIKLNKFNRPALHFYSVDSTTRKWAEESTYGGKLVENAVQAVARDLLAEAMIRVEKNDYQIVLHAHDELVVEVPEKHTKEEYFNVGCLMCDLPKWANGLPIKAETWVSKRYKK